MKQEDGRMNRARWETVLSRWSDFPSCPEKRLVIAVLAEAIHIEAMDAEKAEIKAREREAKGNEYIPPCAPYTSQFWLPRGGFDAYCKVVNLNSKAMLEQVQRVAAWSAA